MTVRAMALDFFFDRPIKDADDLEKEIRKVQSDAIACGYKLMFLAGRPHPTGHELWVVGEIRYLKDYYMSYHCPGYGEDDWAEQEKYLRAVE